MFFPDFHDAIAHATAALMKRGVEVDTGSWQGYKTQGKPDLVTLELLNLAMEVPVEQRALLKDSSLLDVLRAQIKPNVPWADDHFAERVSRDPSNPGEEYKNWPWWQGQSVALEYEGKKFSHTYQERIWPKFCGDTGIRQNMVSWDRPMPGLRYDYGDLDDVISLLLTNPYTRQATLPIFFPEDTGADNGNRRVPCTLHWHFLLREDRLHLWYPIRSCDLVRHFRDDLYLAARLLLWVLQELVERELRGDNPQLWVDVRPGTLFFTAYSFHVHKGDMHHVHY